MLSYDCTWEASGSSLYHRKSAAGNWNKAPHTCSSSCLFHRLVQSAKWPLCELLWPSDFWFSRWPIMSPRSATACWPSLLVSPITSSPEALQCLEATLSGPLITSSRSYSSFRLALKQCPPSHIICKSTMCLGGFITAGFRSSEPFRVMHHLYI